MQGKIMKIWYAVSGRGQGQIFTTKPERNSHFRLWTGHIEGCVSTLVCLMAAEGELKLPLITWEDDPLELKISITAP